MDKQLTNTSEFIKNFADLNKKITLECEQIERCLLIKQDH